MSDCLHTLPFQIKIQAKVLTYSFRICFVAN